MNILHVLSNYRWTERAEPATDLVLAQRDLGLHADLVCGRNRGDPGESVGFRAARKGVDPFCLELPKHFEWSTLRRDLSGLRRLIRTGGYDVVHAHMENGWLLSALAVRGPARRPLCVASLYDPAGLPRKWRNRWLANRRRTDGLAVICEEAAGSVCREYGFPEERIGVIEPGVDVERFGRAASRSEARRRFRVEGAFVVGMVTAVGGRRRLDLVLQAVARLVPEIPGIRLLVIGRGKMRRFLEEPARALGIRDRIVLGGYCRDDDLRQAYAAMDGLAYPMHGTDRSCRTVREALAAGVPVIASRVGFLPRLVRHGETGFLVDPAEKAMAEGIRALHRLPDKGAAMARRARQEAARRFDLRKQAAATQAFYERLDRLAGEPEP